MFRVIVDFKNLPEYCYQGLLYILHVELDWHRHHFVLLKNSLESIEQVSILNNIFVLKSPPMRFDLSICEKSITHLIDYKTFNHEIVAYLASYINQIRNINYFLDFNNANAILSKIEDEAERKVHIKNYFLGLKTEYIDKTMPSISEIRILIEQELKNYPKDKIVNKET